MLSGKRERGQEEAHIFEASTGALHRSWPQGDITLEIKMEPIKENYVGTPPEPLQPATAEPTHGVESEYAHFTAVETLAIATESLSSVAHPSSVLSESFSSLAEGAFDPAITKPNSIHAEPLPPTGTEPLSLTVTESMSLAATEPLHSTPVAIETSSSFAVAKPLHSATASSISSQAVNLLQPETELVPSGAVTKPLLSALVVSEPLPSARTQPSPFIAPEPPGKAAALSITASAEIETSLVIAPEPSTTVAALHATDSLSSSTTELTLSIAPELSATAPASILTKPLPSVAIKSTLFTPPEPAATAVGELLQIDRRTSVSASTVAEGSVAAGEPVWVEGRERSSAAGEPLQLDRREPLSSVKVRSSISEPVSSVVKEALPSAGTGPSALVANKSSHLDMINPLPSLGTGPLSLASIKPKLLPLDTSEILTAAAIETLPSAARDHAVTSSFMPLASSVSSVDGESVLIVEGLGIQSGAIPPNTVEVAQSGISTGKLENAERQQGREEGEPVFFGGREALIGSKVRKKFGNKYYFGEIIGFDPDLKWYRVKYEDEDEEELDWGEIESILFPLSGDAERPRILSGSSRKKRSRLSDDLDEKRGLKRTKKKIIARRVSSARGNNRAESSLSVKDLDSEEISKASGTHNLVDLTTERGPELADDTAHHPSENMDQTSELKEDEKQASSSRRRRGWRNHRAERSPKSVKRKLSELHLQGLETPAEHRIMTRSSTGSLGAHGSTSSGRSSPRFKKDDSQEKTRLDSVVSRLSPLGGGFKIIGRKTHKDFGGQFYTGEVVGYDPRAKFYKVRYEDGDEEELEWNELKSTLASQEEQLLAIEGPVHAAISVRKFPKRRLKDYSRRIRTPKGKQRALVLYDGRGANGELFSPRRRRRVRTASVSVMMKGNEDWATAPATPPIVPSRTPPRPLVVVRFASVSDADILEYFGWGEVVSYEKAKCPELRAVRLLPTSSPIVHLAASRHHLAAITATGHVWVWRNKHGSIHTRCNEWEHISILEEKGIILVDIAGPNLERSSAGYEAEQEDQVPDPFYLAAVCSSGEDIILQGSQPHEMVRTYQLDDEPRYPGLKDTILYSYPDAPENVGRIVQVSVGTVEASDESPFVGYITDTDRVYIRSATRDFMEETNLVAGYTGRPIKIQCGSVYHAILMTDDGRAWSWGRGYYPGSSSTSSGFSSKWSFSACHPAVGTLVGRKVVDVGCYGEDFVALTNDGDVHQWTHGVPNPAAGVYNVPATPIYGQGPCIASGDKLKQVSIGAGMCAGITESGRVHTWRTTMKGGLVGMAALERETLTPLGRDEGYKDTTISSLGVRVATKVMCMAGSLIVVVKRKSKSRRGGKKKSNLSATHKMKQRIASGR